MADGYIRHHESGTCKCDKKKRRETETKRLSGSIFNFFHLTRVEMSKRNVRMQSLLMSMSRDQVISHCITFQKLAETGSQSIG